MAEVVQSRRRQAGLSGELAEPPRHLPGVEGGPVLPGEHEPVVGVRRPPRGLLGVLGESYGEQRAHGAGVQVDRPGLS
ncbi:MAG: hypothetical protein M3P96_10995 [Actinomycetota bacterium]|nr:hypothetical protein [Actinomycetota bacterium]